jgi:hypothetical protein
MGASGMTNIVNRLRQTRANMLGTEDEEHYWICHEAADELEGLNLHAWNEAIETAAIIAENTKPLLVEQTGMGKSIAAEIRKLKKKN